MEEARDCMGPWHVSHAWETRQPTSQGTNAANGVVTCTLSFFTERKSPRAPERPDIWTLRRLDVQTFERPDAQASEGLADELRYLEAVI